MPGITLMKLERGRIFYYGSAKFREQIMYRVLHGQPDIELPSTELFFITDDIAVAKRYTSYYDDSKTHFGKHLEKIKLPDDTVLAYKLVKEATMLKLDIDTVNYLLYEDSKSPFHYSKIREKIDDLQKVKLFTTAEMRPATRYLAEKKITTDASFSTSGFALLLKATSIFTGKFIRESHYAYDYILARLMRDYLEPHGVNGWYQPEQETVHSEYMFFKPGTFLKRDLTNEHDWSKKITKLPQKLTLREPINISFHKIFDKINSDYQAAKADDETLTESEFIPDKKKGIIAFERAVSMLDPNETTQSLQTYINKKLDSCKIKSLCKSQLTLSPLNKHLDKLLEELSAYANAKNDHHIGATVKDHSLWVMRTIYNWLKYSNDLWTGDIPVSLHPVILVAAFMHDIGKIGDRDTYTLPNTGLKPEHPIKGLLYLQGDIPFRNINAIAEKVNINVLSDDSGLIVKSVVRMHHYLGEVLMQYNENIYRYSEISDFKNDTNRYLARRLKVVDGRLKYILDTIVEFKYIMFMTELLNVLNSDENSDTFIENKDNMQMLIKIICAVSAADVFGAYPVDIKKHTVYNVTNEGQTIQSEELTSRNMFIRELLEPKILDAETSSNGKHRELNRPFYKYLYNTLGIQERNNLIAYDNKIQNYANLADAWRSLNDYIRYLYGSSKHCPAIFKSLESYPNIDENGVPSDYITALMRLLKVGYIKDQPKKMSDISGVKAYITAPMMEGDNDKAKLGKYEFHRVSGLEHLNKSLFSLDMRDYIE